MKTKKELLQWIQDNNGKHIIIQKLGDTTNEIIKCTIGKLINGAFSINVLEREIKNCNKIYKNYKNPEETWIKIPNRKDIVFDPDCTDFTFKYNFGGEIALEIIFKTC